MKFKSDIEVQAGLKDSSGALGLSGQILSSTSGNVSWVTPTVNTVARDVQNEVKAGVAITKGQAVYVTGADGTNIIVGLASNATEATSSKTLGLLNATVAVNGFADVVQIGRLSGLNTLGATEGDPVWLGTGGNLIYGLTNKPYAPAHLVFIGIVTRVNLNNGEIFVSVQNGFELNEIHDVDLKTTVPINGDILGFNGTLWVNKTIAQWLGYTPANASGTTNYVSKFTGTTTLGNSQIFDNGTNVGIGTISPSTKLNIASDGYNFRVANGVNASGYNIGRNVTDGLLYFYGDQTGYNGYVFSGVDGERMRITSAGNVGIGTSSPTQKLDVSGVAKANSFLFNASSGGGNWQIGSDGSIDSGKGMYIYNSLGDYRISIKENGNVGIGTTSPAYKLDVAGTSRFAENQNGITSVIAQNNNLTNGAGQAFRFYFDGSTPIGGIFNQYNTSTFAYDLAFQLWNGTSATNRLTINGSTGAIKFNAYGSGTFTGTATQKLAVDGSGNIIEIPIGAGPVDGSGTTNFVTKWTDSDTIGNSIMFDNGTNVGIGTTAPISKLDLGGTENQELAIKSAASNRAYYAGWQDEAIMSVNRQVSNGTFANITKGAGSININSNAGGSNIKFLTSNTVNTLQTEKMRITEAGNVGIGTTTPGSILDVQSTAAAIGTTLKVSNTSASGGNYLQLDRATNSRVNSLNFSTAGVEDWSLGVLRNAGNATQIFSLSYQSAGNINSTGFAVTNTGNVGIGTTSPVAKLHVAGSTYIRNDNTTNQLTIDNDSVGTNASPQYSDILFGGYSTSLRARIRGVDRASNTTIGGLILQSSTDGTTLVDRLFLNGNGESYFYNNSSEVMRITSAGNIEFGKGLNSPKVFSFEADTTGVGNSLGGFQWKNTQWDSNIRASINAITDTALANGALIFSTGATNANATEKMRITSDGNVGINDTAPSDKFVVNGRARINGTNALAFGNNAGGYAQIAVSGATTGNLLFSTYDGAALGERMRITTTGNVGIGTTTPLSSLQVSKNQTSDTAITVTNGGTVGATTTMSFVLQEGGTPQGWFRRYKDNSGLNEIGFSTDLSFSGNVTTTKVERMRITSTGNVGIGTTSPSAKLDLYSSSGGVSFKTYTATTNYTEHSYSKDAGFFIDSYQSVAGSPYTKTTDLVANGDSGAESQMRFFTATTATSPSERMRITSGGNVGIGTTSELARTTILSDSSAQAIGLIGRSADNISTIRWWNNAGNSIYTAIESNANYTIYNTVTNGYAGFYTNNTERMRITSTGNVGIGTTSPTQKLDVVGNAKISGSVQVGDDSATASATNVGATRYRSDANNSYVDMVMQTGASTYAWVNIVQNNW